MLKKSKIIYLFFCVLIISTIGCNKENRDGISTTTATVVQVKYACGPACDAFSFIIRTPANELFTPIDLPQDFRTNNLPVKIRYKNTGKLPIRYAAPGYELIEIVQISR